MYISEMDNPLLGESSFGVEVTPCHMAPPPLHDTPLHSPCLPMSPRATTFHHATSSTRLKSSVRRSLRSSKCSSYFRSEDEVIALGSETTMRERASSSEKVVGE